MHLCHWVTGDNLSLLGFTSQFFECFRKWLAAELNNPESVSITADARKALEQLDTPAEDGLDTDLRDYLVPLCATYLLNAKRGKEPLDPVARFHLKNGARLDRINWLADTSASGIKQSFALMANYVYELHDLEHNHELYTRCSQVTSSRRVQAWAKHAAAHRQVRSGAGKRLIQRN